MGKGNRPESQRVLKQPRIFEIGPAPTRPRRASRRFSRLGQPRPGLGGCHGDFRDWAGLYPASEGVMAICLQVQDRRQLRLQVRHKFTRKSEAARKVRTSSSSRNGTAGVVKCRVFYRHAARHRRRRVFPRSTTERRRRSPSPP